MQLRSEAGLTNAWLACECSHPSAWVLRLHSIIMGHRGGWQATACTEPQSVTSVCFSHKRYVLLQPQPPASCTPTVLYLTTSFWRVSLFTRSAPLSELVTWPLLVAAAACLWDAPAPQLSQGPCALPQGTSAAHAGPAPSPLWSMCRGSWLQAAMSAGTCWAGTRSCRDVAASNVSLPQGHCLLVRARSQGGLCLLCLSACWKPWTGPAAAPWHSHAQHLRARARLQEAWHPASRPASQACVPRQTARRQPAPSCAPGWVRAPCALLRLPARGRPCRGPQTCGSTGAWHGP